MKIAQIVRSLTFALMALIVSLAPALAQGSGGQTTLKVYNSSNNAVTVWLTLNNYTGNNPGFYQNVATIPFKPTTVITPNGGPFQGSFSLAAGKMVSLTPPVGTAIAGNFCFGNPPNNCRTTQDANGQNLAEFTLDTNTPAFSAFTQEAIDISCVNGVNAKLQFDLTKTSGAGSWKTAGQSNVTTFANTKFTPPPSSNINLVGVFPVGCDLCTGQQDPGCSPQWTPWNVGSSTALCNVQRPASQSGGTVLITFKGFYPVALSQTNMKGPR